MKARALLLEHFGAGHFVGNEKWSLYHCVKLLKARDDTDRLDELLDLFDIANHKANANIHDFYLWYKQNHISSQDSQVYQIFDTVCEQLNLPQASPNYFSRCGAQLIERINAWKGKASNTLEDILIDYFSHVVSKAIDFQPMLVRIPKSLLADFGWGLFEEYINKKHGGRTMYLNASEADLLVAKQHASILGIIQDFRILMLQEGNLALYDEIGKLLTWQDIEVVYDNLCANLNYRDKLNQIKTQ